MKFFNKKSVLLLAVAFLVVVGVGGAFVSSASAVTIVTTSLPTGRVGSAYSADLVARGTGPYSWSFSNFPTGLNLDPATGHISGTPALAGTHNFTIYVTDNGDHSTANSGIWGLNIVVVPASAAVSPACVYREKVDVWNNKLGGGYAQTICEGASLENAGTRWTCKEYTRSWVAEHVCSFWGIVTNPVLALSAATLCVVGGEPYTIETSDVPVDSTRVCDNLPQMNELGCCVLYEAGEGDAISHGNANIGDCYKNTTRKKCLGSIYNRSTPFDPVTGKLNRYSTGYRDMAFVPNSDGSCEGIKIANGNQCPEYDPKYGATTEEKTTDVCSPTCNISGSIFFSEADRACICCGDCSVCNFVNVFLNAARFGLGFLGVIALLMFIWGGVMWITSGGNAERVSKGKSVLTGTVIGIIIVLIAWAVINTAVIALTGSKTATGIGQIFGRQWNVCQ